MKLRSLLLGSAAVAGLATGAFAADPALELTTLNVCDSLGKSGLTISSDTNCLQITGEIKYEFNWGNYNLGTLIANTPAFGPGDYTVKTPGGAAGTELDWASKLEWYIKFVATADTSNGPAAAVLKIKEVQQHVVTDEAAFVLGGDDTGGLIADEAYVSIGGSTVLMIGKKGSLINKGDDEPLTFLQTFNSDKVDKGVFWGSSPATPSDNSASIQATTDLGNGVSASVGLENLDSVGSVVGVLEYKGEGISAHLTGAAFGILDGTVDKYALHAGFTGSFDTVTFKAAVAYDDSGYYNALATAQVVFDIFKIAGTVEAVTGGDYGFAGSIGATVADGVELNLGGRYYLDAGGFDGWQVAASVSAAVTETIKLTAEVGDYGTDAGTNIWYGALEAAYNPGGGLTASVKGEAYSNGAFIATVKGAKAFD